MVAVGSTLSAFWILVANSWQQTPAGYIVNPQTHRAELVSFAQAVFNRSMPIRFCHVMDAALICGAFFVAAVAAFLLLKDKRSLVGRKALKLAVIVGLITAAAELFPFGHEHARQTGNQQPEKMAAFEGLFETGPNAPLTLFGIPTNDRIIAPIRIPGLLSLLVGMRFDRVVTGLNDFAPEDRPPVFLPFAGFHAMVGLGMLFIALMAWAVLQLWRDKLWEDRWTLTALMLSAPLPVLACLFGWIVTEVGRQPWIVYRLLRTADAISTTVSGIEVLFSLVLFGLIYALLGVLYLYLIVRLARRGPEADPTQEAATL